MTGHAPRRIAAAFSAAMLAAGVVLYRYPPAEYSFYPRCPIHAAFGVLCPGCGATRAVAALLHGRISEAMHDNALIVLLMPFLLAFAAMSLARAVRYERFRWPQPPDAAFYALGLLTTVFTVVRNLR